MDKELNDNSEYYELRCNADRKHTIKNVEYPKCGNLFGGVKKDKSIDMYLRCPICKCWNHFYMEENSSLLHFSIIEHRRFVFSQPVRTGR